MFELREDEVRGAADGRDEGRDVQVSASSAVVSLSRTAFVTERREDDGQYGRIWGHGWTVLTWGMYACGTAFELFDFDRAFLNLTRRMIKGQS